MKSLKPTNRQNSLHDQTLILSLRNKCYSKNLWICYTMSNFYDSLLDSKIYRYLNTAINKEPDIDYRID